MQSKIYEGDAVANQRHEFGEADELRYPALFVRRDGTEQIILLTGNQIDEAKARSDREPEDRSIVLHRLAEAERRAQLRLIGAIIAVAFAFTVSVLLLVQSP